MSEELLESSVEGVVLELSGAVDELGLDDGDGLDEEEEDDELLPLMPVNSSRDRYPSLFVSPCEKAPARLLLLAASTEEMRPSPSASSLVNAVDEVSIVASWVSLELVALEVVLLLESGGVVCANAVAANKAAALMIKVFISFLHKVQETAESAIVVPRRQSISSGIAAADEPHA